MKIAIFKIFRQLTKYFIMLLAFLLTNQCADDISEWEVESEDQVITEYLETRPETFSEISGILDTTGIKNLLRVRGPFTFLAPTNDAMQAYYQQKGVSSYKELDVEYLTRLVNNHLFALEISTDDVGYGALPVKNSEGDFVTSEYAGSEIILNKTAKIILRDERTSNGVVHHIDKVLDLITKSVYEVLGDDPAYSIFYEGLLQTGIFDTLNTISFDYGDVDVRAYFTLLAVPDTLYQRYGINSFEDLASAVSSEGNYTNPQDSLYMYIDFHCLTDGYYLSDLEPEKVYPTLSNNSYVNIQVRDDYIINEDTLGNYTSFFLELSNIPAKNGVIHTVDDILTVEEVQPALFIFETTDFFDLKREPCYGRYYQRYYDGQNTFKDIKWDGEYLMYYYKDGQNAWNKDVLSTIGHFWIELTTPKIMKGKYQLSSMWWGGDANTFFEWFVDGESVATILSNSGDWGGTPTDIAIVEFKETKEHKIKISALGSTGIWWDRLHFEPVD